MIFQKAIDFLINKSQKNVTALIYTKTKLNIYRSHFFYRFEQLLTVYGEESFELKVKLINTLFDYLEEHFQISEKINILNTTFPTDSIKLFGFYSSREHFWTLLQSARI